MQRRLRKQAHGSKPRRKPDANTLLLIKQRALIRKQQASAAKNNSAAAKVTFDEKTDSEESATTNAKPYWRDNHLTVLDGPGWVFSTKDGAGWNQEVF